VGLVLMGRRDAARDEAGAIAVLVGITATVLFVIAAMVVDLGLARDTRRQSQNAADASALAAANALYATGPADLAAATATAKNYALVNFSVPLSEWAGCTDPTPLAVPSASTPCISFDSATQPNRVRVRIPIREVKTGLGAAAGVSKVDVGSVAEAELTPELDGVCGMCILGSGSHDFGTTNLFAQDTDVAMNGQLHTKKIFQVSPAPPHTLAIEDGLDLSRGGKADGVSPTPTTGGTVSDPLASLVMPTSFGPNKGTANPCVGGPGIYSTFNNITGCTLAPGLYVVTGATSLTGHHDISGDGVTLYLACGTPTLVVPCTPVLSKNFDMTSQQVHLNLTAATAATAVNRAVPGVAILADRAWTGTLSFQGGGGGGTTQGAIYLKSGTMHYGGNSDGEVLDAMIVVDDFAGNGNSATLQVTNTGTNPPDAGPKSPRLYK
jgi:hypothetical protein